MSFNSCTIAWSSIEKTVHAREVATRLPFLELKMMSSEEDILSNEGELKWLVVLGAVAEEQSIGWVSNSEILIVFPLVWRIDWCGE